MNIVNLLLYSLPLLLIAVLLIRLKSKALKWCALVIVIALVVLAGVNYKDFNFRSCPAEITPDDFNEVTGKDLNYHAALFNRKGFVNHYMSKRNDLQVDHFYRQKEVKQKPLNYIDILIPGDGLIYYIIIENDDYKGYFEYLISKGARQLNPNETYINKNHEQYLYKNCVFIGFDADFFSNTQGYTIGIINYGSYLKLKPTK